MKDIYPMYRLCRLMYEDGHKWQHGDLTLEVVVRNDFACTDEEQKAEVDARIRNGEKRGRTKEHLIIDYLKRYYPNYCRQSEAFGTIVNIGSVPSSLYSEVREIIEQCLGVKYGYLSVSPVDSHTVVLTDEGRDLASPPYLYFWFGKRIPINVGLINAYLKALGESRVLIVNLIITGVTLWASWVVWGANLLQYFNEK